MKWLTVCVLFFILIAYQLATPLAFAQGCNPNGEIDPNSWSQIESYTCDPNNPGTAGQEWACFGDDGKPQAIKFSNDVSDTDRCPITSDQSTTHQPIQTPIPTLPQPSTQIQKYPSTEEQAIYNQCNGSSPGEICPNPPEDNLFKKLLNIISKLFFFSPQNTNKLNQQTTSVHDDNFPNTLQSQNTSDPSKNLQDDLGTSNSYYSINEPDFSDRQGEPTKNPIGAYEQDYQQENFPEGITPITGTQSSPAPTGQTP